MTSGPVVVRKSFKIRTVLNAHYSRLSEITEKDWKTYSKLSIKRPVLLNDLVLIFSNSRSLKQPGLIKESLEYAAVIVDCSEKTFRDTE